MANIYTSLLAYTDPALPGPTVGRADSRVKNYLQKMEAKAAKNLSAAMTAANEVTAIADHLTTTSGGNYTLTVNATVNGITYTTASLLYDATAEGIETALDAASPATVGDGDITVTADASGLDNGECQFTCDGNLASVPVLITITNVDLTGSGNGVGAVTRQVGGQMARPATQAITELNIAVGATQDSGDAVTLTSAIAAYVSWPDRAPLSVIKWLALATVVEDGVDLTRAALIELYPELLTPA